MAIPLARAVPVLLAVVLLATGCGGDDEQAALPDGPALLAAAADEMAGLDSVGLDLVAELDVAGLAVRELNGVVTRAGQAEGTVTADQFGQLIEVRFVLVDDTFYFQLFGGWNDLPRDEITGVLDPSRLLGPEGAVPRLLRTAERAEVTAEEDGRYRVHASFDPAAVAALVPGLNDAVTGTLWIGADRPLLHRAEFPPPTQGAEPVTVELSRFDESVTITAP